MMIWMFYFVLTSVVVLESGLRLKTGFRDHFLLSRPQKLKCLVLPQSRHTVGG